MKFFVIENNPERALYFQDLGIDYIFVDLEKLGKEERQANLDSVKSNHSVSDIYAIKKVLNKAKLVVRIDPINDNTETQINEVINAGADYIMLPFFLTYNEVEFFTKCVNRRAKIILLFEHYLAINSINEILKIEGINKVYFGLNDLSISMGYKFMFKTLSEEVLSEPVEICKSYGIEFGIGGIGPLDFGILPGSFIIKEYKRLGASSTILSRSLIKLLDVNKEQFEIELKKIMHMANNVLFDQQSLEQNLIDLKKII